MLVDIQINILANSLYSHGVAQAPISFSHQFKPIAAAHKHMLPTQ